MDTINISLPSELKNDSEQLVRRGYFASFSDLVQTALRKLLSESQYDLWASEAKVEHARGQTKALTSTKDIDVYLDAVTKT